MDFNNYIFRAHSFGKVFSASGKLTETNKSYLKELFISEINSVRKSISSKYFEKGLFNEESGITMLNETLFKGQLILKNKERKSNGLVQGECDVIKDGCIYDIKNAWDVFTFGNASLTHDYKWQLKVYMWLWGVKNARLFYCLNNTPEHLIIAEEKKLFYSGNYLTMEDPEYLEDLENLKAKHTHDNKNIYERFKFWDVSLEPGDIEIMENAINTARAYLLKMWQDYQDNIYKNKIAMGVINNG
jgi:hypothetical protein